MDDKRRLLELLVEKRRREAINGGILEFIMYHDYKYTPTKFHKKFCAEIDKFISGETKKLMVFIPPQHGKSTVSTMYAPAKILGENPNERVGVVSYAQTKASEFNVQTQRIITSGAYKNIYPDTRISEIGSKKEEAWKRTSDYFEVINKTGFIKSVGVQGGLTGTAIDTLIMDDLYKNALQANSKTYRKNVIDMYNSVADSRLHNNSRQLITFTRWHPDDLAGYLLRHQKEEWTVIRFPQIKEDDNDPLDNFRYTGETLWEERHSKRKALLLKERDPNTFNCLHQQNPSAQEGKMYNKGFGTYSHEVDGGVTKAYVDVADTGQDYLCCIIFTELNGYAYVKDVYYTQRSQEITEGDVALRMHLHEVSECVMESNAGGRAFMRNVERIYNNKYGAKTNFTGLHQKHNKESRILTNAPNVQEYVKMPVDWEDKWKVFSMSINSFMRMVANANDDAEDTLTGVYEIVSGKIRTKNNNSGGYLEVS